MFVCPVVYLSWRPQPHGCLAGNFRSTLQGWTNRKKPACESPSLEIFPSCGLGAPQMQDGVRGLFRSAALLYIPLDLNPFFVTLVVCILGYICILAFPKTFPLPIDATHIFAIIEV